MPTLYLVKISKHCINKLELIVNKIMRFFQYRYSSAFFVKLTMRNLAIAFIAVKVVSIEWQIIGKKIG